MKKLHKIITGKGKRNIIKGEQRIISCSNKAVSHCSPLIYEYIESFEKLEKGFNILFEEVIKINKD